MPEAKTRPTDADPHGFIEALEHPVRRADGFLLLKMMREASGEPPVLWGPTIIGFGAYHYRYASGREGDAAAIGFSPRKSSLSLYGMTADPASAEQLARLGKHKVGAACLYVNTLADVDLEVLRGLMTSGYRYVMTEIHQP